MFRLTQLFQQAQDIIFNYPPKLLAVIRNLQYQKLSLEFQRVRKDMIQAILQAKIKIGIYEFILSPEFLSYFPAGLSTYPVSVDEPIIVQRIKRVLDILQRFERLFNEIETLYISPIEPDSTRDQLRLVPVMPRFYNMINLTHDLFKEIFDLGLDAESLFGSQTTTWLHDLLQFNQALNRPQQEQLEQNMRLSWDYLSHTMHQHLTTIQTASLPEQFGQFLGQLIHKMAAGDENFQFLIHLMHDVPTVLQDLRVFIQEKLGVNDLHSNISELKRLEDKTRASLEGIDYLHGLSLGNVLKIVKLIAHIRSIFVAVQSYTKTVGDLQLDIQTGIKQKLMDLKFDYLFNFFVILDDLELYLMLAPGELSHQFSPQIESWYASLITSLSAHLAFKPEDKVLVNLFDVQWHNRRLELSFRRQAQVIARQKELSILTNYVTPFDLEIDEYKIRFNALKDYLRQADDAYYNLSLEQIHGGGIYRFDDAVGKKVLAMIEQEKIQLQFRERRLLASHQYLDDLQNQVLVLLPLAQKPSLKQLQQRLWYQSAIVRFGGETLFYNGHLHSITPLATTSQFVNTAVSYGHIVGLTSQEFMCFSQSIRQMIKSPRWIAAYCDENLYLINEFSILGQEGYGVVDLGNNFLSLKELMLLADSYQAQVIKLTKIRTLLMALFNFIMALSQSHADVSLSPEKIQVLLTHFLRVGPYLLDGLEQFSCLLAENKIKVSDLKDWAKVSILGLLEIYERHLELYQQRNWQIECAVTRIRAQDYLRGFATLAPLQRVGFLLRSNRYSMMVGHLREHLRAIQTYYSPKFLAMIQHEAGYCPNLLEAETYLAQAQQTLDFQLIWNATYFLEQFIQKMESLQHQHLLPTYKSVPDKWDMVLSFLTVQSYFLSREVELKRYQKILKRAYHEMKHVLMAPHAQLNQYVLHQNDQAQNASGLEQVFHWILNGDEIFKDLVRPHYNEPDFKAGLEAQTQVSMAKIRSILARTHFLSLVTETFNIYQLMKEVKGRFNRLVTQIYQVNLEHLPNLKQELFGALIKIVDDVEINLGLNPRYFSQIFVACLDVIFEHYLQALHLDPLLFAQLITDPCLTETRIQQSQLRLADIPGLIAEKERKQKSMATLVVELKREQFGLVSWDPQLPAFQESNLIFLNDILPVLVEMLPDYRYTLPQEFLSKHQLEVDRLIQSWIDASRWSVKTHDYLNMIQYAMYFLEGQVKSLGLEQALLIDKQDLLGENLVIQQIKQPELFEHICQHYYRDTLHGILSKYCQDFNYLKQDYLTRLKADLPLSDADLGYWRKSLERRFEAGLQDQETMQQIIETGIHTRLTPINQKLHKNYQVMDAILTVLEEYYLYLHSLSSNVSWFNQPQLNLCKIQTLVMLKNLIKDPNLKIEERVQQTLQLMQDPQFIHHLKDTGLQQGSWLQRLFVSVWQTILNLLSYLGVFCQAQKPMVWMRQLDKTVHAYSLFSPSRVGGEPALAPPIVMPS